ncbi:Rap1a/Tai family immunity protein [Pseudomonas sp. UBA1879]|uniref:Rap1a/Tai family immunity protein n=1 Tax=Pseudomonas sp. UBA1879 TaxID=1947305 RepID=UPI0025D7287C|nr:Rap1a/Tai family immunity protein [Pseudomonas sp. UBA1879]
MFKSTLFASALFALSVSASALADGNKLLLECQDGITSMSGGAAKNPVGIGHCVGVLQATMDTLDLVHEAGGTPKLVCVPEGGIPMIQSMRIVVQSLAEHPQSLHLNESVLVTAALKNAFPCE